LGHFDVPRLLFNRKDENRRQLLTACHDLRRAVAKFDGLLKAVGNRKLWCHIMLPPKEGDRDRCDLAGGTILNIRSLLAPLTVAVFVAYAGQAFAQGAFPAPLPNQVQRNDPAFPPVSGQAPVQRSDPAFPPVNGGAPTTSVGAPPMASFPAGGGAPLSGGFSAAPPQGGPPADCMQQFTPLREDTEKRGKEIKAASDHHATPDVACKLIGGFSQSELKMIKYVEKNSARCGIPPQVSDQLKNGHKNTEVMLQKVCDAAKQSQQRGPAGPTLSDVLGSSAALPEATTRKKGGSTFDTLSGNVLTR
jgi:hypothetical protein